MAEELDRFEVFVLAVFIRNPVSIAAAVIQVQHRCNGIHAKPVDVEVFHPVEGIRDQEVFNLIFTVVKDLCAPVRMFSLSRVRVLVERLSVKVGKSMGVFREVSRNPVQDHADALFMKIVYEVHELLRSAVTGGRCVVSGDLVAPGTVIRMFCNSHELYMGVAHLLHIVGQLVGCLHICIITFLLRAVFLSPGAEMNFVDRHRGFYRISFFSRVHPACIFPFKTADVFRDGSGSRTEFCVDCIRVSFEQDLSILCGDRKFVEFSKADARNKCLIDPRVG